MNYFNLNFSRGFYELATISEFRVSTDITKMHASTGHGSG